MGGGRRGEAEKGEREARERWNKNIYEVVSLCFFVSGSWVIRWHLPTLGESEFPSLYHLIQMTTPTTGTLTDVSRNSTLTVA